MAKNSLKQIFLSASIPLEERDKRFFDTVDIIAIRDAVRALATIVVPKAQLVWGGHPSITPLIRHAIQKMNGNIKQHVTLYQSKFFDNSLPDENNAFEDIRLIESVNNQKNSLHRMRTEMIGANKFAAAVFIGGMDGVLEEYQMFIKHHPNSPTFPVASTGAASKILYDENKKGANLDPRLENDYAYMALFRDLLRTII